MIDIKQGLIATALVACVLAGCTPSAETKAEGGEKGGSVATKTDGGAKGSINIDGSSTLAPVTTAVVDKFNAANPDVKISVSDKGTGAGIKAFIAKEIDICDASRAIKDEEIADAAKAGVEFVEVPVAFDGLSIVVNPKNDFAKSLTVEELKKIWEPGSKITNWKDVRAGFPDKPLKLFGPTTSHGSFEYFCEAICKTKKKSREDYEQCTDYNALVAGISQQEGGLGYVGFNYYERNKDKMKLVAVDAGKGPVEPNNERILSGEYSPLSRPLLIYINKSALDRAEVSSFVKFYLTDGKAQVAETGYTPLPDADYAAALERAEKKVLGSIFKDFKPGMKLADIMKAAPAAGAPAQTK